MKVFDCQRLRKLRKLKGYSLEMTARLIEVRSGVKLSRSAISHWELGKAVPSVASLTALAELFNVPLDYFFDSPSNCLFDKDAESAPGREA